MTDPTGSAEKLEIERQKLAIEHDKLGIERQKLAFERTKVRVDVWKKSVDVQQHFNDLELRIRNFAVTVLTAVLGAAGLAMRENLMITALGVTTSLAVWFLGVGVVAWGAFYFMDRWWYHRLLYGAVLHAGDLEKDLDQDLPNTMGLATHISKSSPFYISGWKIRSPTKIDLFYGGVAIILVVAAVVLHLTLSIEPAP
jgi:hypothetical protein